MKKNLHPIFQLLVFLGILAGQLGTAHAATCSYTLELPTGISLIANQCELRAGNTLNNLFPAVPNGSKVAKYINNPWSEVPAIFNNGAWTPNLTLDPGEGAFFENPGPALTVTISGERNTLGWPLPIYQGFQIVSRREPLVSHFTASEGWAASADDQILRWDPVTQNYSDTIYFDGSKWVLNDFVTPTQVTVNVGESVVYFSASGSSIDPCNAAIRWQPSDVAVVQRCCPNQADCATFSVDAIGTAPFTYQWFANDVLISGATDATYTLCPVTVADSGTRFSVRVSNACKVLTSEVATLTVTRDPTPPVLTGLSTIAVQCDVDIPPPNPASISAVDACGSPLLVVHAGDAASGSCPKTITRTYNATDSCGNVGTFTQTITVQDTTAPVLIGPADLTVQCDANVPAPDSALVSATDNCDPLLTVVHVGDVASGQCPKTIQRTYQATDACGNVGTFTQTITVQDTIAPALTGPADLTVQCDANVPVPDSASVSATDNCDPLLTVVHVGDVASGQCPKTIRRTYQATDACGNVGTFTQTITVQDTIAPVLTGPADLTVPSDTDVPAPDPASVSATDNCDQLLVVVHVGDIASGQSPKVIRRTYQATDACGNVGTFTQSITVLPPPSTRSGLCGFSQGFYGNVNGKFNGVTSRTLVGNLLGQRPLVVGILGARSLSIEPGDGDLLQLRMPSGGTPTSLPANGDQTLRTANVPLNRKSRFDNVLLGQTITLSLNVRLSPGLANVGIAPSFCTQAVLPGPDGRRGTEDDELVTGDIMTFQIPDSVRMALANPTLGIQDSTVRGLLELANRALAGLSTGGASWSAVNDAVDSINCGFDGCRQLVDCTSGQPIPDSFNDGFEQRPTLGGGNAPQGGMGLAAVEPPGNLRGRVTNLRATKEPGEPEHAGLAGGKSVWWRWVCPRTGPVLLTTTGSSVDTVLAVYTGSALENLASVASNDDSEDGTRTHSELIFEGVAGTEYQIAVDSFEGGIGTIVLSLIIDRPRLNPPTLGPNDAVALEVEGPRGRTYTVEASSDLEHWTPITSQRNADGVLRFKDPARQIEPHRFYRAVLEF